MAHMADENGRFLIDLDPGTYHIEFSSLGYYPFSLFDLDVRSAHDTEVEVSLQVRMSVLDSVVVQANEFYRTPESPLGVMGFSQQALLGMPGATMDLSKYLKTLPGVAPKVAFGYNLSIRGGAPFENSYYIDGIEIPSITHFNVAGTSGGPNGLINPQLIQNARLFTANLPAEYHNAISGILDMKAARGSTEKWNWNFTLGATDFGLQAGGPVSKKSTLLISARESFSQHMLKAIGVPVIPFYSDAQVNWHWKINSNHEISIISLFGFDRYTLNTEAEPSEELLYNTGYIPEGQQLTWTGGINYKFFGNNTVHEWILSHNYFRNTASKFAFNDPEQSQLLDFDTKDQRSRLTYQQTRYLEGNTRIKWGLNTGRVGFPHRINRFVYDQFQEKLLPVDLNGQTILHQYGGYFSFSDIRWDDRLDYNLSLRMDGSDYSENTKNPLRQLSPRIAATYHLTGAWNVSIAIGQYFQLPPSILLAANDLFRANITYLRSRQAGIGAKYTSGIGYQFELNLYSKKYADYPVLQQSGISLANATSDYVAVGDEPAESTGKGRSHGLTFNVKKQMTKLLGWQINYAFTRSEFTNTEGEYKPSSWDNSHALNFIAMVHLNGGWKLSGRWFVSSGSPFSPYNRAATAQKENWSRTFRGIFDYNQVNSLQLPAFHSLDLRVDKRFNFKKWTLTTYIDVQNVYQSKLASIPYLTAIRADNGFLQDPTDPTKYQLRVLHSDTGRMLPTIGVIFDF